MEVKSRSLGQFPASSPFFPCLQTWIFFPHPALHQRKGCWQQITPVCGIRVLQRGDPCIKSHLVHVSAEWGVIYSHGGLPSFYFIPDFHTSVSWIFCLCMNGLGRDLALLGRRCCCPWWDRDHTCPRRARHPCLLRIFFYWCAGGMNHIISNHSWNRNIWSKKPF